MKTIRTVFAKEVTDNFRDRRTLMTALLMGPLFGPILFAFVINLSVKQSLSNDNEALDLSVIGRENAPNLVAVAQRLCDEIVINAEGQVALHDSADGIRNATGCEDLEEAFVKAIKNVEPAA